MEQGTAGWGKETLKQAGVPAGLWLWSAVSVSPDWPHLPGNPRNDPLPPPAASETTLARLLETSEQLHSGV